MQKIVIIIGTRPEAIKMAPVIRQLKAYHSKFKTVICLTSQHREMLDQVLRIFAISPDHDLNIMQKNQNLFDITVRTMTGLKDILKKESPDMVMIQGDTTTAFVAGLAAYYLEIPIGHIEAGLRTYNKYHPFPEEANRHLLSVLADYHFAPTKWAKSNLIKEGIKEENVWVTGNTVIDALFMISSRQKTNKSKGFLAAHFKEKYNLTLPVHNQKLLLVTGHRRENFGEGFKNICYALKEIAERRKDVTIIYPVHLNPNVQKPVRSILNNQGNIHLIEPLEYELFVFLMNNSYIILTDSGGIQEEAPSLCKPVLVMRHNTERPEGVEAGTVKLVGTDKETIINNTFELLENQLLYEKMSKTANPYGDGKAAERIVNILLNFINR
ncbi:MAG: UDP-N-acetylglucosamine 2-epimerase (non-hydrolyzing) [Thermodesulfobacteriota bacterium]|nr:UDP-N-acetylglucosamine 2-epimerase (non-hydrolyzing) [Thermodesulfobacteriota bacterium]